MSQVSCHHGSFYLCKQCSFTHNELLEKVKDNPTTRAVVELHKPTSPKQIGTGYVGDIDMCSQCKSYYPCLTIQYIEKELK